MQTQQVQQRETRKPLPRNYVIIAIVTFLFFALSAASWILNILHVTHEPFFTFLSVVFTFIAIVSAFVQWLFPYYSHDFDKPPINGTSASLVAVEPSVTETGNLSPSALIPASLSSKTLYRDIVGVPPPTIPKTIHQRAQLVKNIYTLLTSLDTTAVVLTGIGGIGKSTLASLVCRYAEEQRNDKSSTLFVAEPVWIRIDSKITIGDLAGTLQKVLDKPMPEFDQLEPGDQANVLFNALKSPDKARLIILDDFEKVLNLQTGYVLGDRPGISELLYALNSQPSHCRVLITSRIFPQGNREYPLTYVQEYHMKGLDKQEGAELLRKQGIKLEQATDEDLLKAVERCQGHALALILLASLLRRNPNLSLSIFLEDSAYRRLWVGDISSNLLNYIYMKQLHDIHRKLLRAFSVYGEPVKLEAAHALLPTLTKPDVVEAGQVLLAQNLLQTSEQAECYQLHPIVAEYARNHFDDKSQQVNTEALKAAHAQAAEYYLQLPSPPYERRRTIEDVHFILEAFWHFCQAEQWKQAYDLTEKECILPYLKKCGGNTLLLEIYQALLPLEHSHPLSVEMVTIYTNLGRVYRTLGERETARKYLEKALVICDQISNLEIEGFLHSFLGNIYYDLGDYETAQVHLHKSLTIRQKIEDREGLGWTQYNLGRVYVDLGQAEQARESLTQALTIHREVGDSKGEERALNILARVYDKLGQKELAREYYMRALNMSRQIRDRLGEGAAFNGLGAFHADLGQYDKALNYLHESLEIRREVGDRGGVERTLSHLGRLYRLSGQLQEALATLNEALEIGKEIQDRSGEWRILNNLGLVYFDLRQYDDALKHLKLALQLSQAILNRHGEGWTLHNLGRVYTEQGQYEKAHASYEQALEIRREVGDRRGEGWTLYNLGLLFARQEMYPTALTYLLFASDIFEVASSPDSERLQSDIEKFQEKLKLQEKLDERKLKDDSWSQPHQLASLLVELYDKELPEDLYADLSQRQQALRAEQNRYVQKLQEELKVMQEIIPE